MTYKVFKQFETLVKAGVVESLDSPNSRRIILVNTIALITTIPPFLYLILFVLANRPLLIFMTVPFALAFTSSIYFNRRYLHKVASLILIMSLNSAIFVYSSLLGSASGIQYVTLATAAISLVILNPKDQALFNIGYSIPIVTFGLLILSQYHWITQVPVPIQYLSLSHILSIIVSFGIIFASIRFYISLNRTYELSLEESNLALFKRSQDLEKAYVELSNSIETNELLTHHAAYAHLCREIAHEIKNPLAIIHTGAEIMLEDINNQEATKKFGEKVIRMVNRLIKLVSSMMQYGETSTSEKTHFEISPVLADICELAQIQCSSQHIKIQRQFTPDLILFGDRVFIYQTILNIVSNAVNFTPDGGQISVSSEPAMYFDSRSVQHSGVKITIEDTGLGILPENIDKIFTPYFSTRKSDNNVGLGLSFAIRTVLEHNGKLTVDSIMNEGTRFSIYLPSL